MAAFDEVEDVHVGPQTLDRLIFDRHASRYRIPIDWVRWILELLSPTLRVGQSAAPSLLFDMNKLFETAVASFLRGSLAGTEVRLHAQKGGTYLARIREDGGRLAFALKPDLVLRRNAVITAIADTKWKRLEVDRSGHLAPSQTDVYQMHAYATAFGCEHLALIYPWHSGLAGSRETTFELPLSGERRSVVSVVCIDLRNDPIRTVRGAVLPDPVRAHFSTSTHLVPR
jgi:5-methylcytosine-specific restriction enzyme subunit McrC